MTSSAAALLTAVVLTLLGAVGIFIGVLWRRWGYTFAPLFRVVGVVLAALGVWLVLDQANELTTWGAITRWPSVDGVILTSRVAGDRAIHPEIVYQYTVADTTYRDSTGFDTPSFGGKSVKEDESEAIVAMFPSGAKVRVHYDPQAPARSRLRVSPDWSIYGKIGLGGVLLGLGFFLIVAARSKAR
ncbi:hypothetical protein C3F09_00760 [candidate division GN15 bacterium]|uniref:DUF3592 domain-containing protein n=1 Tax=candidate division GN15 bacterium TaxID=2072418 RepID=A0A855X594_9BACT|nr:MAG: hypothetical protein C3F09_00760 [candidate division GN15 bacterium]